MAAGDVFQGRFSRTAALGTETIAGLVGGTTYCFLQIKAEEPTELLVGNSTIDSQSTTGTIQGYRMSPGEILTMENHGAVAGEIDGAKIRIRAVRDNPPARFTVLAIANV
jgi:hypothetical protein